MTWVSKGFITVEGFAILECRTIESAVDLLHRADVPTTVHDGLLVVHYANALKSIDVYYDGLPQLLEDPFVIGFQVFWASKAYMDRFLQEYDFEEVDLILGISEKKHTNLVDLFESFVKKRKSPDEFAQWFPWECEKFLIHRGI